jgi:hypothetical protein
MSTELALGKIIEGEQHRDAIHIAVAPVVAAQTLAPGWRVGPRPDGTYGDSDAPNGIVDPFLEEKVRKGQRFWLFLFPNTVTGMRHHWQHPAFADHLPTTPPATAVTAPNREESHKWLADFAERHGYRLEDLLTVGWNTYLCSRNGDMRGDVEDELPSMWMHLATYNQKTYTEQEINSVDYSCSC